MKQKLFALGDDYTVVNEDGDEVATIDTKIFSIGKKLKFYGPDGGELARIEKRILAFRPTYDLIQGDRTIATVTKDLFTLFRCSFTVDVPGPDDLEAQGSFTDHEYTFSRGGQRVATVSKAWFSLRDTYGVEVENDADAILVLASTVVIDLCCHEEQEGSS